MAGARPSAVVPNVHCLVDRRTPLRRGPGLVPVLPVALHQRVLFAESAAQGLAVFEAAPNSDAAREIAALVENIENQWRAAA